MMPRTRVPSIPRRRARRSAQPITEPGAGRDRNPGWAHARCRGVVTATPRACRDHPVPCGSSACRQPAEYELVVNKTAKTALFWRFPNHAKLLHRLQRFKTLAECNEARLTRGAGRGNRTKSRPSAGPARKRMPSDERGRRPGNRPSAKVSSQAPNAGKTRAVSGPGRSEFSTQSRRTRSGYASEKSGYALHLTKNALALLLFRTLRA